VGVYNVQSNDVPPTEAASDTDDQEPERFALEEALDQLDLAREHLAFLAARAGIKRPPRLS
jgi:predicted phage-related endonuclease